MLEKLLDEARRDEFWQKWLTGYWLRINVAVVFAALAVAMHFSLVLMSNYKNWPVESKVIQYASLFSPLISIFFYRSIVRIDNIYLRKTLLFLSIGVGLIGIILVSAIMGILARGEQHLDPFGFTLLAIALAWATLMMRLAWRAGQRISCDE